LPIFEWLNVDESARQLAAKGADATTLRQHANTLGMKSLRECGWQAVMQGKTTVDEILRLTGVSNDAVEA
jgi:general secretion pathway protein E